MIRTCQRRLPLEWKAIRRQSTSVKALLAGRETGNDVSITGWISHKRKLKNATFLDVIDGSTYRSVQVVASSAPEAATVGSSVRIQGTLTESRGQQDVELQAKSISILGEGSGEPNLFPIQSKGVHTADYLRTYQHLRPRASHMASILRLRSHLVSAFHQFFVSEGFYYTNPPIVTRADAEGAGESFTVAGNEKDFFGLGEKRPRLTVSSQLHLEALMMGLGRVWTFSPTFRAERSITSRHLAEFWMLEAEWLVDDLEGLLCFVEKSIKSVVQQIQTTDILEELGTNMKGQDNAIPVDEISIRWARIGKKFWTRIKYHDAVQMLIEEHARQPFDIPPKHGAQLQSSHEQFLASQLDTPVFITHYPVSFKPFYMLQSSKDSMTVENFDLLLPGMGEIAGGSLRIHDLSALEKSMRDKQMDETELEWYKDLRRWGSVPHGGFGLGFDRLIGYLAGVTSLREVVAFPRMFGKSGCLN